MSFVASGDEALVGHLRIMANAVRCGPRWKACNQVQCPRMKVCVENMQRLPLCTCPSTYVCRRAKKREVCGTDGKTYPSRCHMKVASCNDDIVVRKKYRGPCTEEDEANPEVIEPPKKVIKPKKVAVPKKKQPDMTDLEIEREKRRKRRKEMRRRRRRKIGIKSKGRARRHRVKAQAAPGPTFDETFPHYTWSA
uniref:Kazal-like domain-containing protein n=1 Tax=Biomphalaria glabrata TaxID=6526 RepID=A0A2C9L1X3_BIOGL